jgi:hypothetical protein
MLFSPTILIVLVLILLFYFAPQILVPIVVVTTAVEKMREDKQKIVRTPGKDDKILENLSEDHKYFLQEHNFMFYGSFQYEQVQFGLWEQQTIETTAQYRRFFALMNQNKADFVTQFSEHSSLTSGGHDSAFMYPRPPESFLQSKKTNDLEQLWQYHTEGEKFLIEDYGVQMEEISKPVEKIINQELIDQGIYISKIPLYWLRAPYWYHIKRYQMLGISIREQLKRKKK